MLAHDGVGQHAVAEAVHDRGDGERAAEAVVQGFLGHGVTGAAGARHATWPPVSRFARPDMSSSRPLGFRSMSLSMAQRAQQGGGAWVPVVAWAGERPCTARSHMFGDLASYLHRAPTDPEWRTFPAPE